MKQVDYNSFLFQVAYGSFSLLEAPKKKVSLCRFFWSIVFGASCAVFASVIGVVFFAGAQVGGFFVARRLNWWKETIKEYEGTDHERTETPLLVFYKHWPTFRGNRIYPMVLIGIGWILYSLWFTYVEMGISVISNPFAYPDSLPINSPLVFMPVSVMIVIMFIGIVGLVIAIAAIAAVISRIRKTQWSTVIREYLKAKKERVCPILEIVGAPPEKETTGGESIG